VSLASKTRVPGNGDFSSKGRGSNPPVLRTEDVVLAGPFGRQVGKASNSHTMGKPTDANLAIPSSCAAR
jgi:hypothetical protein